MRLLARLSPASAYVCVALIALAAWPAAALDLNGFMPGEGQGALALSYTSESYDEFWVGNTKVAEPALGEIENTSQALWFTWGFRDNLAVVANLARVETEASGPAQLRESGLQDLAVLLKYRAWQSADANQSLVVAAGLRTPVADYLANGPVSIGDETTDALVRFVYLLEHDRFFWSQQVGFDSRGDDAPDGFPIYTELGWRFERCALVAIYSRYIADGGTDIGQPGFTFPSNKDETERLGAKVYGNLHGALGFSVAGFTTLDGRNSGDAEGFSLGLTWNF